ncbi:proline-rich region [Rhodopseudomonas palustris HaA2]|uniref:Proline-rich region n=1 Tax=Rhodopseudomonas palustris (strain HaA2) TaxID=316058 RepID=Q2IWF9_RHOP2|nr:SPOR domain-containing protein [Rhodopseudomonas palustris]ABD07451.1 proline-rich region [Rhodopseudomonas palustris HaA2]
MTDRYQDRPYLAEGEAHAAYAKRNPENDPLAELARLIGQTDPFGQEAPPSGRPSSRSTDFRLSSPPPIEDEVPPPTPSWLQHRRAADPAPLSPPEPEPDFSRPPSFVTAASPRLADPVYDPAPFDRQSFDQVAEEPNNYDPHYAVQQPLPLEPPQFVPGRYDDALYGQLDPADVRPDPNYPEAPYGYDDGYADEPDSRAYKPRRNNMMTVAAVLALAVVGTGGAFAYRSFTSGPRTGEPPVIKADASPTKVMAAPSASADAAGKPIQDRLAAGNNIEALVSREEQPADPSRAGQGTRVVLPQLNQNPNPPAVSAVAPGPKPNLPPPNNGTIAGEEPRRIKTFSIRPDQGDPGAAPVNVAAPATRQASRAPAPTAPAQRPAARQLEDANASAGNTPLSLAPNSGGSPAANQRVAALPPTESAGAGGYVVQVSSQRSEADAKSSYRTLQGKFPSVLGQRAPLIKRADLGSKGVYYRAMVGPFGSSEEASRLCGNLKSAGGQCVVQRN